MPLPSCPSAITANKEDRNSLKEENEKLEMEKKQLAEIVFQFHKNNYQRAVEAQSNDELIDKLKAEKVKLKKCYENFIYGDNGLVEDMRKREKENQQLKAENEKLSKDVVDLKVYYMNILQLNDISEAENQKLKAQLLDLKNANSDLATAAIAKPEEHCEVSGVKLDSKACEKCQGFGVINLGGDPELRKQCPYCSLKPKCFNCNDKKFIDRTNFYGGIESCSHCNSEPKPINNVNYDIKITGLRPFQPVDVPDVKINGVRYVFDADRYGDATQGYANCWGEIYITLKKDTVQTESNFEVAKAENNPYICPVCNGEGITQVYDPITAIYVIATPTCKACNGNGIVWESN